MITGSNKLYSINNAHIINGGENSASQRRAVGTDIVEYIALYPLYATHRVNVTSVNVSIDGTYQSQSVMGPLVKN